jgi:hypothetical protein
MTLFTTQSFKEQHRENLDYLRMVVVPDSVAIQNRWQEGAGILAINQAGGTMQGALVLAVAPGSDADNSGIEAGDMIESVDGQDDVGMKLLGPTGKKIDLQISRLSVGKRFKAEIEMSEHAGSNISFRVGGVLADREGTPTISPKRMTGGSGRGAGEFLHTSPIPSKRGITQTSILWVETVEQCPSCLRKTARSLSDLYGVICRFGRVKNGPLTVLLSFRFHGSGFGTWLKHRMVASGSRGIRIR